MNSFAINKELIPSSTFISADSGYFVPTTTLEKVVSPQNNTSNTSAYSEIKENYQIATSRNTYLEIISSNNNKLETIHTYPVKGKITKVLTIKNQLSKDVCNNNKNYTYLDSLCLLLDNNKIIILHWIDIEFKVLNMFDMTSQNNNLNKSSPIILDYSFSLNTLVYYDYLNTFYFLFNKEENNNSTLINTVTQYSIQDLNMSNIIKSYFFMTASNTGFNLKTFYKNYNNNNNVPEEANIFTLLILYKKEVVDNTKQLFGLLGNSNLDLNNNNNEDKTKLKIDYTEKTYLAVVNFKQNNSSISTLTGINGNNNTNQGVIEIVEEIELPFNDIIDFIYFPFKAYYMFLSKYSILIYYKNERIMNLLPLSKIDINNNTILKEFFYKNTEVLSRINNNNNANLNSNSTLENSNTPSTHTNIIINNNIYFSKYAVNLETKFTNKNIDLTGGSFILMSDSILSYLIIIASSGKILKLVLNEESKFQFTLDTITITGISNDITSKYQEISVVDKQELGLGNELFIPLSLNSFFIAGKRTDGKLVLIDINKDSSFINCLIPNYSPIISFSKNQYWNKLFLLSGYDSNSSMSFIYEKLSYDTLSSITIDKILGDCLFLKELSSDLVLSVFSNNKIMLYNKGYKYDLVLDENRSTLLTSLIIDNFCDSKILEVFVKSNIIDIDNNRIVELVFVFNSGISVFNLTYPNDDIETIEKNNIISVSIVDKFNYSSFYANKDISSVIVKLTPTNNNVFIVINHTEVFYIKMNLSLSIFNLTLYLNPNNERLFKFCYLSNNNSVHLFSGLYGSEFHPDLTKLNIYNITGLISNIDVRITDKNTSNCDYVKLDSTKSVFLYNSQLNGNSELIFSNHLITELPDVISSDVLLLKKKFRKNNTTDVDNDENSKIINLLNYYGNIRDLEYLNTDLSENVFNSHSLNASDNSNNTTTNNLLNLDSRKSNISYPHIEKEFYSLINNSKTDVDEASTKNIISNFQKQFFEKPHHNHNIQGIVPECFSLEEIGNSLILSFISLEKRVLAIYKLECSCLLNEKNYFNNKFSNFSLNFEYEMEEETKDKGNDNKEIESNNNSDLSSNSIKKADINNNTTKLVFKKVHTELIKSQQLIFYYRNTQGIFQKILNVHNKQEVLYINIPSQQRILYLDKGKIGIVEINKKSFEAFSNCSLFNKVISDSGDSSDILEMKKGFVFISKNSLICAGIPNQYELTNIGLIKRSFINRIPVLCRPFIIKEGTKDQIDLFVNIEKIYVEEYKEEGKAVEFYYFLNIRKSDE